MFKNKTAYVMFSFLTSSAIAGTMGPVCEPGHVTVPCTRAGWGVGIEGLYLKAAYNADLNLVGVRGTNITQVLSPDSRVTTIDEVWVPRQLEWGWGFRLQGAYYFGAGKDVNINWLHYNNTSQQVDLLQPGSLNIFENFPQHNHTESGLDAVNLEAAQQIEFQEWTQLRYYAGFQFARIRTNIASLFDNYPTDDTPAQFVLNSNVYNSTRFNGFGPRIGADLSYYFLQQLSVYGKAATTLLLGKKQFSSDVSFAFFNPETRNLNANVFHTTMSLTNQIVPELEAQIGLAYQRPFALGDLSLNVGYMWMNYFNALQNNFLATSDFGLSGINFGAKWVG